MVARRETRLAVLYSSMVTPGIVEMNSAHALITNVLLIDVSEYKSNVEANSYHSSGIIEFLTLFIAIK